MHNHKILVVTALAALIVTCTALPQEGKEHELTVQSENQPATTPSLPIESSCLDDRAQRQKNKELVMRAFQEVIGDHNIEAADKYFTTDVIEHNQYEKDGLEAFKIFAANWVKNKEKEKIHFYRISAEGDLVWSHVKIRGIDEKEIAIMDIFRIENDRIAEHWDVVQPVPELGKSKNPHPLF